MILKRIDYYPKHTILQEIIFTRKYNKQAVMDGTKNGTILPSWLI